MRIDATETALAKPPEQNHLGTLTISILSDISLRDNGPQMEKTRSEALVEDYLKVGASLDILSEAMKRKSYQNKSQQICLLDI